MATETKLAIGALVISSIALILSIVAIVKGNNPGSDENSEATNLEGGSSGS